MPPLLFTSEVSDGCLWHVESLDWTTAAEGLLVLVTYYKEALMAKGLLGLKVGMTQWFNEDGTASPCTVLSAGPCTVLQVKTENRDGYTAVQLGVGDQKSQRVTRPLLGHYRSAGNRVLRWVREFRMSTSEMEQYAVGQTLTVTMFNVGDHIDVVGVSKGKGFQGGLKRWGWKGGPGSHGSMFHRRPGSIGASADPSRVFKGKHLPGHMGNARVTVQNLEIIHVDPERHLLVVKGAVPGARQSWIEVRRAKKWRGKDIDQLPESMLPGAEEPEAEAEEISADGTVALEEGATDVAQPADEEAVSSTSSESQDAPEEIRADEAAEGDAQVGSSSEETKT